MYWVSSIYAQIWVKINVTLRNIFQHETNQLNHFGEKPNPTKA